MILKSKTGFDEIMQIICVLIIASFFYGCGNKAEQDVLEAKQEILEGENISAREKVLKNEKWLDLPEWLPSLKEIIAQNLKTKEDWKMFFNFEIHHRSHGKESFSSRPSIFFDDAENPLVFWEQENVFINEINGEEIFIRYNNLVMSRWNGSQWTRMDSESPGSETVTDFSREKYPEYWKKVSSIQFENAKAMQMKNFAKKFPDKKIFSVMEYNKIGAHWIDGRLVLLWNGKGGIFTTQWNEDQWVEMDGKTPGTELAVVFKTENEAVMNSIRFKFAFDEEKMPLLVWREPLKPLRGGYEEAKNLVKNDGIFLLRFNGNEWTQTDNKKKGPELISRQPLIAYTLPSIFFDLSSQPILVWVSGDILTDSKNPEQKSKLLVTRWNGSEWSKASGSSGRDEFVVEEGLVYHRDFSVSFFQSEQMVVSYYSYVPDSAGPVSDEKKLYSYMWDGNVWVKFEVVAE